MARATLSPFPGIRSFRYNGEDGKNPWSAKFAPIFDVNMLGNEPSGRGSGAIFPEVHWLFASKLKPVIQLAAI